MSDGDLRKLFAKNIHGDWCSIETWSTGRGVPDANFCINGIEGWIEFKLSKGWKAGIRPEQVAWIERRKRNGGKVFIAIRRKIESGQRRGDAVDELWIFDGSQARILLTGKVDDASIVLGPWDGGPKSWPWAEIRKILIS